MADSTSRYSLNFRTATPCSETCNSIDYFTGIMNKIHNFYNNKNFCDITLVAKDNKTKIDAHKVILCAASEYFLAMFGGCMREAGEKEVRLQIDGSALESVINYIYTASIELTTENVEEILITTNLLELAPLKTLCCEFIVKQLDPSNCLGIALFAEQYSLDELYNTSETFLCDNFAKLCKDEEFFKLDAYQLGKFLSRSDLRVDSEENVFRSLMSWIDHNKPKREEFMSKLLHHVRFPLLTPKFIASAIEPACKSIECERLICKAYKWHLLPEFRMSMYKEKQTQLRNFNGLVIAISGWAANGGTLNVGLYYPTLNDWIYKTGISALAIGRKDFGSTTFKGKLIIAGGILITTKEVTDSVDCLDLKTFEWTTLPPLNTKRKLCGLASLNGCLYAIGGEDDEETLKTVEKYDPSTQQWKYVAALNDLFIIVHVSTTLNKLCVSTQLSRVCQRNRALHKYSHNLYDPETDKWTDDWLVTDDELLGTGTVSVFSNHFFIAVSRGYITRYNYVIKSTEKISIPVDSIKSECIKCNGFGDRMIAHDGKNVFQEYNPFSNEWKMMPLFKNTQGKAILISNR